MFAVIIILFILIYALFLAPLEISKGKKINNWIIFSSCKILFIKQIFSISIRNIQKKLFASK
ncbi:MAG: hypothetical protein ACI9JT_000173 [Polaribacter sp.]|jgi:hypothetical protein